MEKEIWKEIEGYPNYCVSNKGRIKNLNRNKILKGTSNGRYKVVLIGGKNYKRFYLHRLVAMTFIPKPKEYEDIDISNLEVDHINGDVLDNCVENLRWCTKKENCNYQLHKDNLSKSLKGKIPWNKGVKRFLSEETYKIIAEKAKKRCSVKEKCSNYNKGKKVLQYDLDGNFIKEWINASRAAEFYKCASTLIYGVCNNRPHCNTAKGFIWRYKEESVAI